MVGGVYMKWMNMLATGVLLATTLATATTAHAGDVRLKELARVEGIRNNLIVGQGLVVGLAGTGDTARNKATQQSVMNMLNNFGISVSANEISARNSALVSITAELPAFAQPGDAIDVVVSSVGDARSLVGGTLLMAPLKAANDSIYALAQGQVSVGGFKFDLNGNSIQKNHPAVGSIPNGATIEQGVRSSIVNMDNKIRVLLKTPDFTTASRIKSQLVDLLGDAGVKAVTAGIIEIDVTNHEDDIVGLMAKIENVRVEPDRIAKIVINERTGTLVSGGDIRIDNVTISHGNLRVIISTDYSVSQPRFVRDVGDGVASVVVPDTTINIDEGYAEVVQLPGNTTIADLITSLKKIRTSTRDVITILQAIKASGALNAELEIL